jgi:2-methylcitrate dehydratase PrpD
VKSVFGGLGRVRVFVMVTLIATAGVVAMPAAAHADTLVGCDTPGLVAAISAANTQGAALSI